MSFSTVVFGANMLKILQICVFSPPKYCMLFLSKNTVAQGGLRAPQDRPPPPPHFATPSLYALASELLLVDPDKVGAKKYFWSFGP